jgi:hypothetical protein
VSRLGLARRSLLLVGVSETESSSRYGGLLTELDHATPAFLHKYHDAFGPFCGRDEGFAHPRGPYRLPAAFRIRRVAAPHHFQLREDDWILVALEVVAAMDDGWAAVDDRGLCIPKETDR